MVDDFIDPAVWAIAASRQLRSLFEQARAMQLSPGQGRAIEQIERKRETLEGQDPS
ncbi:hypothetical protein MY494_03660 [Synechococcus sp. A10-1-5-1]|uniref:hypothetical protein n=1 Tax=Synechococcus sp. A10-1-5-1 TaxID=2936507 RepID=UPI002001A4F1|nr:hypothetical protein [Synechococcus sp. A10-1-5-1]UPM50891.1 hypothetical protein MY494_03660 [Synechococcus sp. A10-1-5-1]